MLFLLFLFFGCECESEQEERKKLDERTKTANNQSFCSTFVQSKFFKFDSNSFKVKFALCCHSRQEQRPANQTQVCFCVMHQLSTPTLYCLILIFTNTFHQNKSKRNKTTNKETKTTKKKQKQQQNNKEQRIIKRI